MKKNYVMLAAFAAMLAFSACSSDDALMGEQVEVTDPMAVGEDVIEISVSNTGVGTRAARPLGSSAAANQVNKVQLKFYKKSGMAWSEDNTIQAFKVDGDKAEYAGNVIDFTATVTEVPNANPNIEETKKIKLSGLAANTEYRIVAYGYHDAATTFPYGTPVADTAVQGLFTTGTHTKEGYTLEEVFAGYVDAKATNQAKKFSSSPVVTLTRQVAGMLAYFKIPYKIGTTVVEKVTVSANDQSTGFKFPNTLLTDKEFNGLTCTGQKDVLMTFTMKGKSNDGEYYTTTGTNVNEALADNYQAAKHLALVKDAFFGARFVLPYDAHKNAQTLTVELWGSDTVTPLKTLKVVTDQPISTPAGIQNPSYNFDIRCNNFYSIGKKLITDNTGGYPDPDPDKPNPEPNKPNPDPQKPDKPIDLGATEQIVVEINDAWEVLHNMDVEE